LLKEMNPGNQIYIRIISLFMMTGSEFSPDKYIVISSDFHKIDDNKNELIVVTNFFDSYISMMSEYNHIDVRYVAVLYDCKKRMMYISGTHSIDRFFKS